MNDWRKPCEHGQYDEHQVVIPCVREHELGRPHKHGFGCLTTEYCPGGSPVTAADLEADTELVERIRTEVGWLYISLDVRDVSPTVTNAFVSNLLAILRDAMPDGDT